MGNGQPGAKMSLLGIEQLAVENTIVKLSSAIQERKNPDTLLADFRSGTKMLTFRLQHHDANAGLIFDGFEMTQ